MTEYLVVDHLSRKEIRRIFAKIQVDKVTGCWNWIGKLSHKGYARVRYQGRLEAVHRLVYAWVCYPIPRGYSREIPVLDHVVCDNRRCCNPAHLELKSQRDNTLRGSGACAVNAKKLFCPKGHPLPVEADLRYGRGRRCPICLIEKRRAKVNHKKKYDREYQKRKRLIA